MRFTKQIFSILAIASMATGMVGCHDDDTIDNGGNKQPSEYHDSTLTADALQNLLYNVTPVDTLPSNWQSESYTVEPNYGDAIHQDTPHIRYVAAASTQDARDFFKIVTGTDNDNITVWTHDSIGSVTLNTDSTATQYGSIRFNVKQVPTLEEIRFVPSTALGTNAADWTPYYKFGHILKVEKQNPGPNDKPEYWICIRGEFNGKTHKEFSYWACFTMSSDNIGTKTKNGKTLTYPKNLGGKKADMATLPQLLRIILNPHQAWTEWSTYSKDHPEAYKGYNFLDSPFARNYYLEQDFVNISNTVLSSLNNDLSTLVPAFNSKSASREQILSGNPLTLIFHGPKVPVLKVEPVEFNDCVQYSGDFYTTGKEFDYKYQTLPQGGLSLNDMLTNPNGLDLYKYLVTQQNDPFQTGGTYLVVRMKKSDKFDHIKTGKNHGYPFTSTTLKFTDVATMPARVSEGGSYASMAYDDPLCPGDVVEATSGTLKGNTLLCMDNNNTTVTGIPEILLTVADNAPTTPQLSEKQAYRLLLNALNAILANNGTSPDEAFKSWEKYDDLRYYNTVMTEMYSQFNSNFATTIEEVFKYNEDTHAVSMNCYRTEDGERVERYMTLSYDASTKKYTLTIVPYEKQARSVFTAKKRSDIGYINLKRTFNAGIYGKSHTNRSNCMYVGNTMASYLLQSRSLECNTEPAD